MKTITGYICNSAKQALIGVGLSLYLIFSVFIVVGPMFGIFALVDAYSDWMLLLHIPWILTLPITGKPLALLLDAI
jgi:hypothetical protein